MASRRLLGWPNATHAARPLLPSGAMAQIRFGSFQVEHINHVPTPHPLARHVASASTRTRA